MIGLLPTTTIFLATAPTDLRKAYDGLAVLVRQSLGQDPLNGSLYVFCNRPVKPYAAGAGRRGCWRRCRGVRRLD